MVPKWLYGKRIGVFDLETDFIPTTMIFCNSIAFIDIDEHGNVSTTPAKVFTYKWTPYTNGSLMESITLLNECDWVAAHNLMSFDLQEVRKHLHIDFNTGFLDTLILAKLIFTQDDLYAMDPQLKISKENYGGYSLRAFGERLGDFKIDYTDFTHLNEEMAIYCDKDTDLCMDLLLFLLGKEEFPPYNVVDLEHKAANIIAAQTEAGFYIDIEKARALNTSLLKEKGDIARELSTMFDPKFLKDGKVKTYAKESKVKKYLPNTKYVPLLGTK